MNELKINNCNFKSNVAECAGVIYNNKLTSIDNSQLDNNRAERGAVIFNTKDLLIKDSKFLNNLVLHTLGVISNVDGNINISRCLFNSNKGSDEGGAIFNNEGKIVISDSKFVSNAALSHGGAIDNSGELTISNSLFDNNQAYGAGAIDNGGIVNIFNSTFTNNKATINGGAIDNNNILNVVGSIFEDNIAGGQGGAIIARNDINLSYSSLFNNKASQANAIYANNQNSNLTDNWWGMNDPDFRQLLNFNISDEFRWIVMSVESFSGLMQYENAQIIVSLNEVKDSKGIISKLANSNLLPDFIVSSSTGDSIIVDKGNASKEIAIPAVSSIEFKLHNQTNSIETSSNPSKIKDNKDVIADYNGKVTFKVRVYGVDGKPVGKNQVVVMTISGKSYDVKTDSNGYASKVFSLVPGKYKITTTYKTMTVKNTITVKKVLKASSKTVKKSKKIRFRATLKTSKGKAIKGKKVTFKIKNKLYSAKTNKKGIATVSFKNLKVGKYTVVIKYIKSQVKVTLKVKK